MPVGSVSPFYLSLHDGIGVLQDTSLDYVEGAAPSRNVSFDAGWTVLGVAGYQFTPWWRTEVEVGGRGNGVSNVSPGTGPSGSVQANTLMFNGYFDIPNQSPVTPYVGAGFGKAWVTHNINVDGPLAQNNISWPLAWQFMAGANLAIAPCWTIGAEYRFLSTQSGLFQDVNGLFYNSNYNNHSFLVGVTWRPLRLARLGWYPGLGLRPACWTRPGVVLAPTVVAPDVVAAPAVVAPAPVAPAAGRCWVPRAQDGRPGYWAAC